jgi:hypothetical protein
MNTELHIEGYRLDITNDIAALLNFAIDDIKDFSSRSTTWSRTIVLPGTANNNRLFGHIFQVGISNGYDSGQPNVGFNFNAAKPAQCIIFQDQLQAFKGVLRLLQINVSNGFQGRVEYEVSVFGNLVGLNTKLTGALLEALDFSAYNHVYNDTAIVNSWDNPGGTGVYYPLIDYGTYSTDKHNWDIKTFRPALYAYEYIDKMFTAAGYRWESTLFNKPEFKRLIIPHSKKDFTKLGTELATAQITSTKNYTFPPAAPITVAFDTNSGTGFTANPGKTEFTYAGPLNITVKLSFKFVGSFVAVGFLASVILDIQKNGASVFSTFTIFTPFTIETYVNIAVVPGDVITFKWSGESGGSLQLTTAEFNITTPNATPIPIAIGDTVVVNEHLPKNIRQIDFLLGIVKLYNLYIYEDSQDNNLFHITPYIEFYSRNTANSVDWSDKLNRNKITKIRPLSELNAKIYKFKYKSDSDYYNETYRKRYNEGYGDRIYDSEFEFVQQTSEFEIVFSATPLVGYSGEDKVYSTILKQTGSSPNTVEENTDSNIRILQSKKITGVSAWNLKNGNEDASPVLNTLTRYGYAGHFDDPNAPTNDINFGATRELFFLITSGSLSNNQFNVYWSGYMREITDKDSKLVTANFYLTTKDILNLDFSKYVYVDGIAYRLNAINDYNATKPSDCLVELVRVNATAYTESDSNSGPPDGCYLLWSDEQTLDWEDGEELMYSSCQDNPGDGGEDPDPPIVYSLNWSFTNFTVRVGFMKIYVDGVLQVSAGPANGSGSFPITAGQSIQVEVSGSVPRVKSLLITNTIEGSIFSDSSTGAAVTHTFTVLADRDYTATGTMTNS